MLSVYVHNSSRERFQVIGGWLAALVLIVALQVTGVSIWIQSAIMWVFSPALHVSTAIVQTIEWPIKAMVQRQQVLRRVQQLEVQYAQAISELSSLEGVAAENKELKRLLENTDREYRQTRIASLLISLARPAVSVGSDAGIVEGSEVISQGVLIGTVSEVTPSISFISLLVQPDHPAILARTRQGTQGIVSGTGRYLVMEEVGLDSPLEVGDVVVTSGQSGISKNLVIGQVVRVIKDPAAPVKRAQLEQIVDFYQTRIVEIIL
jgi:cell shape-determining protein MreC